MAFLVAGTLQVASQMADARQSLERKGKYGLQGPRVALTLSSPGVLASTVAVLEDVLRTLGFESCQKREASVQPEPSPSAQYDLSGTRAALLLSVIHGRPGAQHDVEALGGLCQALNFKTTLRTDPTAQAFQEEMAQFRERLDARRVPVSCALVALMAHGGPQGQLLGADGQEVQPEALVEELSRCRALWGCPKIFLLQACRGGQRDAGVGPTALPWFRRWLQASPTTPSNADVLQIYADAQGRSSGGPTPGSSDQADILMVYAAAEGCVAYRDDEKGSDFIQTLVEVLRADPKGELLELLTEVNRRVCELEVLGPDGEKRRKACLEIRSSLRRRLCLRAQPRPLPPRGC
ncbi:unnamed protein product [Gulo gulo]|uniref:Caspase-14-like n=1 Tax=Gulo gulo TaxID=48420 RepID=A0A9X9PZ51_GULGU|nr:unnamed protein product [Gulo gulo]